MAYNKQTWNNGDTIIAEKLNHMEDGIAGCDCGYEYVETTEILFEEVGTTTSQENFNTAVAALAYSKEITAASLLVTFNGVEYNLERNDYSGTHCYGGVSSTGPDFSNYSFVIASSVYNGIVQNTIMTAEPGTYSIRAMENSVEVTDISLHFKTAVEASASQGGDSESLFEVRFYDQAGTIQTDVRHQEVQAAVEAKRLVLGTYGNRYTFITDTPQTYGMTSYQFDFIHFDRSLSEPKLLCDSILLKYDSTVEKIRKEITTASV